MFRNRTVVIVFTLLAGMAFGSQAVAQYGACGVERKVPTGTMDEPTYRRMNKAYELVGEEQYDEAYEVLITVRNRAKGNYLKAVLAQALAQVEWSRGNYDEALVEFELAVELNALPDQAHFALMYQVAQLYYMKERFDDALDRLDLWFCKVPPEKVKASAYVLQASIHAQKEDWANVVVSIDKAIAKANELGEEPKEPWYQLKLAAHFELQQFPEAADTLDIMITKWPNKKDYWMQLSNTHFKLQDDDKALSVIALAYRKDLLDKQADLLYLSNLYSFRDVPYKAADVMQKGIEDEIIEGSEKHWTMVADAWYAAEELEKALAGYEMAGEAAENGKIDLRRGYILVDLERWEEANEALDKALEKGGLSENQNGEAYLMKGMTEFSMGNWEQASTAWGRAGRYPKAKKAAEQWMNHMREERARKQASL
jgi:tetratricopeptide (TPR) repeat protein